MKTLKEVVGSPERGFDNTMEASAIKNAITNNGKSEYSPANSVETMGTWSRKGKECNCINTESANSKNIEIHGIQWDSVDVVALDPPV